MKLFFGMGLLLQLLFLPSCFGKQTKKIPKVIFSNGSKLYVEIAQTEKEREKGLMHRTQLEKNHGMVFVFPSERILSFWMKNTFIDLDIGYFDSKKILKEIHSMKAQKLGPQKQQDLQSYFSSVPCRYAIEVEKDWFKDNGIKVGDSFSAAGL